MAKCLYRDRLGRIVTSDSDSFFFCLWHSSITHGARARLSLIGLFAVCIFVLLEVSREKEEVWRRSSASTTSASSVSPSAWHSQLCMRLLCAALLQFYLCMTAMCVSTNRASHNGRCGGPRGWTSWDRFKVQRRRVLRPSRSLLLIPRDTTAVMSSHVEMLRNQSGVRGRGQQSRPASLRFVTATLSVTVGLPISPIHCPAFDSVAAIQRNF